LHALEFVQLGPLMERTSGSPDVAIGLIDGPVAIDHPDLRDASIRMIPEAIIQGCARLDSAACRHGTLVAGVLSARRGARAPAICPSCTLLVRPIFAETALGHGELPTATPAELATAIGDMVAADVQVINLSVAARHSSGGGERDLQMVLDHAAARGVLVVAAAGNEALVGSTCITRHPWVTPVVASNIEGGPLDFANLGSSIGQR
jgi:subtilisin family serine protease